MKHGVETGISKVHQKGLYRAKGTMTLPGEGHELQASYYLGLRKQRKPTPTKWRLILFLGDGVLLISLLVLVSVLAPSFQMRFLVPGGGTGKWNAEIVWMSLALVAWNIAVNITKAQELSYATNRFRSPLCTLFALVVMLILWLILLFPFSDTRFLDSVFVGLLFLILGIPVFSIWRILLAKSMSLSRFRRRAVIVGTNSASETLAQEMKNLKWPSINILGYISEHINERIQKDGLPILGSESALHYLISNGIIDLIIMTLDYKTNPELFQAALGASQFGISIIPMPVVYESISGKVPVEHFGDQWYVALQSVCILSPFYLCWKKILDLICGFCGLLFLGLTLPIIALLIYLDSPGPIFYSQERLGLRGKPFRIYKFRSMHAHAEGKGRAVWASENDQRVTTVGRFLRSTHLDELPQLINILLGDMSLIGPRPEREEFVTELGKKIVFYRNRLAVKPGLTGWAQVKYRYGSTVNDALIKLQYDLYYIKHQSIMLDIYIVLKTVIEVLSRRGT